MHYNQATKSWSLVLLHLLSVINKKQFTKIYTALVCGYKTLTETWSDELPANE
ncbi:hypothetical protein [Pantoea sp. Nvir]|uniref:hypothetical protein n=1 Tax=Pantoea sp. Nvir TaxID=2576760 RepID=UPI001F225F0C|nr:hypothetical protein [Pantoea sp. Nvir]CAJ0991519.1 hypothetical protein NVIRPANT_00302 [Pantoea sp. Nvir]